MADPTPRTAASARDALADALMSAYLDERYHGTFRTRAEAILAALPDGWTLAQSEAPLAGRVAADDVVLLIHDVSDPGELDDERCDCRGTLATVLLRHPWLAALTEPPEADRG
jgi:hypothetical protein